jgi:hypothetical protein
LLPSGICTVQVMAIRTIHPIGISSMLPNISSSIWLPGVAATVVGMVAQAVCNALAVAAPSLYDQLVR